MVRTHSHAPYCGNQAAGGKQRAHQAGFGQKLEDDIVRMGKEYADDVVDEVVLFGVNQETLQRKAVPTVAEQGGVFERYPCLAPFRFARRTFEAAAAYAFDGGFVMAVAEGVE